MKQLNNLILLGKSAFAIPIILDILVLNGYAGEVKVIANIDDEANESLLYPYEVTPIQLRFLEYSDSIDLQMANLIIASIGKGRSTIYEHFLNNPSIHSASFPAVIHPSAVVGAAVTAGRGLHLSPLSVIAPYASLGDFVVINRNVSLGHHTRLGNFVTLNPGVNIAGICEIEDKVVIGAGSVVLDKIKIGKSSIIGAGSVVTKNIPDGVIAYGSPAKVIRDISD